MRHAGRGIIRLGDPTDHGGRVINASSGSLVMGMEAALADDMTFCPRCKGMFAIIPDGEGAKHSGRSYAYHDDVTGCGARLITTLCPTGVEPGVGGEASHAADMEQANAFNDRFTLHDEDTGELLALTEYAIERGDGSIEYGMTDKHGNTHLLSTAAASEAVSIYI